MCSELDGDNCRAQQRGDRNSTKQDLTIYKTKRYFAQGHDIGVQCKFHLRTMCSSNKKIFSPLLNSTRTEPSFTIFTRKGGFQNIYYIFLIYVHLKITERWPDNMVTDMFQIWHHNSNQITKKEKEEIQQKREREREFEFPLGMHESHETKYDTQVLWSSCAEVTNLITTCSRIL